MKRGGTTKAQRGRGSTQNVLWEVRHVDSIARGFVLCYAGIASVPLWFLFFSSASVWVICGLPCLLSVFYVPME